MTWSDTPTRLTYCSTLILCLRAVTNPWCWGVDTTDWVAWAQWLPWLVYDQFETRNSQLTRRSTETKRGRDSRAPAHTRAQRVCCWSTWSGCDNPIFSIKPCVFGLAPWWVTIIICQVTQITQWRPTFEDLLDAAVLEAERAKEWEGERQRRKGGGNKTNEHVLDVLDDNCHKWDIRRVVLEGKICRASNSLDNGQTCEGLHEKSLTFPWDGALI